MSKRETLVLYKTVPRKIYKEGNNMAQEIIIYQSDSFRVYRVDQSYLIDVYEKTDTNMIYQILQKHAEMQITDFKALRGAISNPPQKEVVFAKKSPPMSIEVSGNKMSAYLKLSMTEDELNEYDKQKLLKDVAALLAEQKIVFGIDYQFINRLVAGEKILIAEGQEAVNGTDSVSTIVDIGGRKEDKKDVEGDVDFYNLDAIYNVVEGDWVGERVNATEGVMGKNVMGEAINPNPGKNYPIHYDKKTIRAVEENGKLILKTLTAGALSYLKDGKTLSVYPCIEVDNVDISTGNIQTEAFVIVKGSIEDGFKVTAKKGIDVRGKNGVGNVTLKSDGDITITAGINGRGECLIEAGGEVRTKFVNFAKIQAKGKVTVVEYSYHTQIEATEITVGQVHSGKVVGGSLTANYMIEAREVGTHLEKLTMLQVLGFSREQLIKEQEENHKKVEEFKADMNRYLQKLKIIKSSQSQSDDLQKKEDEILQQMNVVVREINAMDTVIKRIERVLKLKGEGTIKINNMIYPKSQIKIKEESMQINDLQKAVTYYYEHKIHTI